MNIFEYATRNQLRYPYKGLISTEDLWVLSPGQLDIIYKELNAQLKKSSESSLLSQKTKVTENLEVMIEIVRYIFEVKQEEKKAKVMEKEAADKKRKILDIISKKQDESLENLSIEELQKMVENM